MFDPAFTKIDWTSKLEHTCTCNSKAHFRVCNSCRISYYLRNYFGIIDTYLYVAFSCLPYLAFQLVLDSTSSLSAENGLWKRMLKDSSNWQLEISGCKLRVFCCKSTTTKSLPPSSAAKEPFAAVEAVPRQQWKEKQKKSESRSKRKKSESQKATKHRKSRKS